MPTRHPWSRLSATLLSIALVATAAVVLRSQIARVPPAPAPGLARPMPPAAARPAPEVRLRGFDHRLIALSDHRGKVVVLNFWASWCVPCRQEMPNLEQAWQEFQDHRVVVLGINVLDDRTRAADFLRQIGVTYPNAHDPAGDVLDAYRVTGLPTTVFIDPAGRIRARFAGAYAGPAGLAELRAQVRALIRTE